MIARGIRLLAIPLLIASLWGPASGCAPSSQLEGHPAVASAKGYAQAVTVVLAGGDPVELTEYATPDQIDRVRRYRMLLEGERGQLLSTRLLGWRPLSIEPDGDAVIVRAAETWTTQPMDAVTGELVGETERRRLVTDYRLTSADGRWLVDTLAERPAEGQ